MADAGASSDRSADRELGSSIPKGTELGETDPAPVPLDAARLLPAAEPEVETGCFCAISCKRRVGVTG